MTECQRRRLAILAADIADSALMDSGETRTIRRLKAHHAGILPIVPEYGVRIMHIQSAR